MSKETKKNLLDLLQNISYGFDEFTSDLEDDSLFWESWSEMHKYISELKEDE